MRLGTSTINFFPLSSIETSLVNYFMTAEGHIYSMKLGGAPRRLVGSKGFNVPESSRTFTLANRSYRGAELFRRAQRHADWKQHTSGPVNTARATLLWEAALTSKPEARSHAKTLREGVRAKGWVIARVMGSGADENLVLGSTPKIHTTVESYKSEMTRLATEFPGVTFVGLRISDSVVAGGVTWG